VSGSRLNRPYYRNGPSHRDGADVTFADIRKMFNFASVQIGRWVTKEEQQIAANLFFDALCDLSDILAVNTEVLSLRGSLHLAFGVGGDKYSSAHYDTSRHRLSLAKNAGGGALAHEWFHAFDHYVFKHMFSTPRASGFASEAWLNNVPIKNHGLNQLLSHVFECIFLDESLTTQNALVDTSVRADKAMKTFYFALPQEVSARAFEAVIQHHTIKNAFLVQGTKKTAEAQVGLYPSGSHLQRISNATFHYFQVLGARMEAQNQ
jgi:hypothetical protein